MPKAMKPVTKEKKTLSDKSKKAIASSYKKYTAGKQRKAV